jgi:uncharacterized protein YigE (DUF2233 family)
MKKIIICLFILVHAKLTFAQTVTPKDLKTNNSQKTKNIEKDSINRLLSKYNKLKKNDLELYKQNLIRLNKIESLTKNLYQALDDSLQLKNYNEKIISLKKVNDDAGLKTNLDLFDKENDRNIKTFETNINTILKLKKEYDSVNINAIYKNQFQINQEIKKLQDSLKDFKGQFTFKYFNDKVFCAYILNKDNDEINFHYKTEENQAYSTLEKVKEKLEKDSLIKVRMITNGGMYSPNNEPQGLYIENYKETNPLDLSNPKDGTNFYMMPNGVFYVDSLNNFGVLTTESFQSQRNKLKPIKHATQSGPMLLINGNMHPNFVKNSKNEKIRSGVGVTQDNKLVFLITNDDCNFYDFASCFQDLFNCKDALFLDGAISKMYLDKISTNYTNGFFVPMISITNRIKK